MTAVQITYAGYCQLGGALNPRLFSRNIVDGRGDYLQTRYYYLQ